MYIESVEKFLVSMFEDLQMVIKGESPIPEYSYPSLAHVVAFYWEN